VLFAFDWKRKAILLVGGDKSDDWRGWYQRNIAVAEQRFDEHQAALAAKTDKRKQQAKKGNKR